MKLAELKQAHAELIDIAERLRLGWRAAHPHRPASASPYLTRDLIKLADVIGASVDAFVVPEKPPASNP